MKFQVPRVKFEFLNQLSRFPLMEQSGNEKDLAAFFTMLALLIMMVATMTATPAGL
jgi:hypothetical protein